MLNSSSCQALCKAFVTQSETIINNYEFDFSANVNSLHSCVVGDEEGETRKRGHFAEIKYDDGWDDVPDHFEDWDGQSTASGMFM